MFPPTFSNLNQVPKHNHKNVNPLVSNGYCVAIVDILLIRLASPFCDLML